MQLHSFNLLLTVTAFLYLSCCKSLSLFNNVLVLFLRYSWILWRMSSSVSWWRHRHQKSQLHNLSHWSWWWVAERWRWCAGIVSSRHGETYEVILHAFISINVRNYIQRFWKLLTTPSVIDFTITLWFPVSCLRRQLWTEVKRMVVIKVCQQQFLLPLCCPCSTQWPCSVSNQEGAIILSKLVLTFASFKLDFNYLYASYWHTSPSFYANYW